MTTPLHYFIYKATNTVNGKAYIGFTKDVKARMRQHRTAAEKGSMLFFHQALRKYGWEAFEWKTLCSGWNKRDMLEYVEPALIAQHNTECCNKRGYNMRRTVLGVTVLEDYRITDSTRAKISAAAKKMWLNVKIRARLLSRMRNVSPETRKKMSAAKIANPPQYWKGKVPPKMEKAWEATRGRIQPTEERLMRSEKAKEVFGTPEASKKKSAYMLGHFVSEDCKKNVGIANGTKQHYIVVHPSGEEEYVTYLREWCLQNGIVRFATAYAAAKNGNKTRDGYSFRRVDMNSIRSLPLARSVANPNKPEHEA